MNTATLSDNEIVELAGNVSTLFHQSERFCAGRLTVKGREHKFSIRGYVKAGEPVTLKGKWVTHSKFGRQFEASEIVYTLPVNVDGLAAWLKWYGQFIGSVKAQKLVDEFGMDFGRILTEDPQQIAITAAIPIESVNMLAEKWQRHTGMVAAASQFAAWGLTQFETESILARFGGGAVSMIADDPYMLLGRVDGFGWAKVDALAAKVGVKGDDPRRLRGAVQSVVSERHGEGHTATPTSIAADIAADKLGGNHELAVKIMTTIDEGVEAGRFRRAVDEATGAAWLATGWGWLCEVGIWKALATSRELNPHSRNEMIEEDGAIPKLFIDYYREVNEKITLDDGQLMAVAKAASYRLSVITGGAGAGKTLVARQIVKFFLDGDVRVMLCAPTGKAGRRLTEVIGQPATTIHRLLAYDPRHGGFIFNEKNPLPDGVVICDEASMIESAIGYALLSACGPNTAVVLIGDPNQLPPVGAGAMLRDILAHDLAPITKLEQCHRQAGTLKQNCNSILCGVVEPHASDEDPSPWVVSKGCRDAEGLRAVVEKLYSKYLPSWGLDPILDVQFMTAKHDGKFGTKAMNLMLQKLHQAKLGNRLPDVTDAEASLIDDSEEKESAKKGKRPTLYVGDKVIHTKNDYELEVMNGTVGVVMMTRPLLWVKYDDRDVNYPKEKEGMVSLAYCLTPHKCQGSEYRCAVVVVPKAHSFMQHRNWFYTAVTRAQKTAVIVGCEDGIRRAAERVENDKRQTLLEVWAEYEGARPT